LAGSLQTAAIGCGRLVLKEAQQLDASSHKQLGRQVMRNVAFSLVLVAFAVLQIAVVTIELTHSVM
jgi:hypothetical protein